MSSTTNNIRKVVLTRTSKPRTQTRPRTRTRTGNRNTTEKQDIPSFQEFIHRQQVISQYRGFLKAIRTIDDSNSQIGMRNEVRTGFKSLMNEEDKLAITMAMKDGERRLKEFKSMVGYIDEKDKNIDSDPDSWLNIDDKDDPRGRVGTNWPWNDK
jgi:hypothetical protein